MSKRYNKIFVFLAILLVFGSAALAQSTLTLSSINAAPGSTITLNLSLASPAGSEPTGLQWTLGYPSTAVASVSMAASPSATAAGKSLACSGRPAAYTCIAYGMNSTTIANGIVAVATVTLTPGAATAAVAVSNPIAVLPDGTSLPVTATGGVITVSTTASPTVTSLSCSPSAAGPGASLLCTVKLSAAAGPGGAAVALSSNSALLSVPASVTVPAGSSSATVTVNAASFLSDQTATVTASWNGSSVNTSVSLTAAPLLTSVKCAATSLAANATTSCTVTLSKAASSGGVVVSLSDNAAALTVPASVTVAANAISATFAATTGTLSSTQTATITASLNGSSQAANLSLVPAAAITSLQCAPTTLAPNAKATCTVALSQPAPGAGAVVTLSDNSLVLSVPASVTVSATATSASFAILAGAFSTNQVAVISAALAGSSSVTTGSSSVTTTIALQVPITAPLNTTLLLNGDATEVSGVTNGSDVHPALAPPGLTGKVILNGAGSVKFVPGSGVYFLNCCSNTNNAYYRFTGTLLRNVFNIPQGQISFTLKSRYTFAQRQSNAASRYAFDARDGNGHQFYFMTRVTSVFLLFTYMVDGSTQSYYVPKGTEDQLFGNAVSLNVGLKWDGSTVTLLLNGNAVQSTPYVPATPNWNTASNFDLGATEYQTFGGYNSLDDVIGSFSVTTPALLQIRGDVTEVTAVKNGSTVTPTWAPPGLSGKVVVNGAGSVNFVPGSGVYFLNCCSNTNNAYYKFTGPTVGTIFNIPQGQISFTLKSRYSFAQRQSNAGFRYAFDARDANGHQYYFLTQITSGALNFTYMVGGVAQYYFVPKGTEDQLFGNGVRLNVALRWDGDTTTLLLNGAAVKSTSYAPATGNWTAASIFDLGAYEYLTAGGYYSADDLISKFTVSVPDAPPPATVKSVVTPLLMSTVAAGPTATLRPSAGVPLLSCSPKSLSPGETALCDLKLTRVDLADSAAISLTSSSDEVKAPAILALRPGQTSVRFEVLAGADAAEGDVVLEAGSDTGIRASLSVKGAPAVPPMRAPIVEAASDDAAPRVLTIGDLESDQALATHANSSMLVSIPNVRFDGQPARPGDVVSISVTGVDCAQPSDVASLRMRMGDGFAPILSLQQNQAAGRVCQVSVQVPSGVFGPRTQVSVGVVGADGSIRFGNTASIAIED